MPLRVKVCRVDEVPPGEFKGFEVSSLAAPILVANLDGEIVATASICPHEAEVSLLDGRRKGDRIVCSAHNYAFDLRSGRCSHDARLNLRCFRVTVVGDEVYVDLL